MSFDTQSTASMNLTPNADGGLQGYLQTDVQKTSQTRQLDGCFELPKRCTSIITVAEPSLLNAQTRGAVGVGSGIGCFMARDSLSTRAASLTAFEKLMSPLAMSESAILSKSLRFFFK